jgi:predicted site-specific integrase-resolvase
MISTKKENDIIIGGEGENERKVIGYIRVSTDEQDSLNQRVV